MGSEGEGFGLGLGWELKEKVELRFQLRGGSAWCGSPDVARPVATWGSNGQWSGKEVRLGK